MELKDSDGRDDVEVAKEASAHVYVCGHMCMCVGTCVPVWAHVYLCGNMCTCVGTCVCVWGHRKYVCSFLEFRLFATQEASAFTLGLC